MKQTEENSRERATSLSLGNFDRRRLLQGLSLAPIAMVLSGCESSSGTTSPVSPAQAQAVAGTSDRQQLALNFRVAAAEATTSVTPPTHTNNGDELRFGNKIACFSKTLPHNAIGEVDLAAYATLTQAITAGTFAAFEGVTLGGQSKLANPVAGQSFDLEGPDPQAVTMVAAPLFDSAQQASEMVELYWMALTRDVAFRDFAGNATIASAVTDLNTMSDFRGGVNGVVDSNSIFRGILAGDMVGPYISQFLLQPIRWGALGIDPRITTAAPNVDYMTTAATYLNIQNGGAAPAEQLLPTPTYIKNLRDLASYVHIDALHQAYQQAALFLLGSGAALDSGNPYGGAAKQGGFVNYGGAHVLGMVTEVATRALKAAWFQKWNVHRRLRPEAYGARVHFHQTNQAIYPIHADLLNSQALVSTNLAQGSFFLSQAYPEGSPTHPSYGAGHATVAGACTTILKAFFDGTQNIANPVESASNGLSLDPVGIALTVEGELNKLCSNISIGRNAGGVHYQTDYSNCIGMGEQIAIRLLEETKQGLPESGTFTLTKFDGTSVTI